MSYQSTLTKALKASGKIVCTGSLRRKNVAFKGRVSLVTQTDKKAEAAICQIIHNAYPSHAILTEESRSVVRHSPYTWVVDPLDGTTNFVHGIPHVGVSIGLLKDGQPIVGGIFDPFRDELFLATHGKGSTLNGRKIRVSIQTHLEKSVILTGFPYDRKEKYALYRKSWDYLVGRTQALRWNGAAALDLCWVACGRADAFWEWNLQPWDCAAGWLLVQEAGGQVSNYKGEPYDLFAPQMLATNGHLHKTLLNVFEKTSR